MAQHDFSIANQTFPATRTDLNNALEALATLSSGATEPTTTYADMLWYDSGNNILKMRSEADDAWINVGYLCQSTNKFCILDDTNVVNTSGTQTGTIGDQATSAWEAGTSTTESLVSPAKVKASIDALGAWGLTLLGTLTTTSGTTQTLSGLDLSDYDFIYGILDGVDGTGSFDAIRIASVNLSGLPASGGCNDIFLCSLDSGGINGGGISGAESTGYTRATTSISFSLTSGNFNAGSIKLYGGKY